MPNVDITPMAEYKPKLLIGARLLVNSEIRPIAVVSDASVQGIAACRIARPAAPLAPRVRTSSR